jgi:phage shock protein E
VSPFVTAVVAVAVLAALPALAAWLAGWKPNHARRLLGRGALLVDVGSAGEFAAEHVEGAVSIPSDEVARRQNELGEHARPIVLYSRTHLRSAVAAQRLRGIGFHDVFNMGTLKQAKRVGPSVPSGGDGHNPGRRVVSAVLSMRPGTTRRDGPTTGESM